MIVWYLLLKSQVCSYEHSNQQLVIINFHWFKMNLLSLASSLRNWSAVSRASASASEWSFSENSTNTPEADEPVYCVHATFFLLASIACFGVGLSSTLLVRLVLYVRRRMRARARERRLRLLLRAHPSLDAAQSTGSSPSRAFSSSPLLSITNSSLISTSPNLRWNEHIELDALRRHQQQQLLRARSGPPHFGLDAQLANGSWDARAPSTLRRRRAASPIGEAVLEAAPGLAIDPPESPLLNALWRRLVHTQNFCAQLEAGETLLGMIYVRAHCKYILMRIELTQINKNCFHKKNFENLLKCINLKKIIILSFSL